MWLPLVPAVAVALALLILPGLLVSALCGARGLLLAISAVPISAFLMVMGIELSRGWWGWGAFLLWVGVSALIAFLVRLIVVRTVGRHAAGTTELRYSPATIGQFVIGLPVLALIGFWGIARGMGSPYAPTQTWDGIFHLSAIRYIIDGGDGSLGAMAQFTGGASHPSGWHAFAALITQVCGDPILAANSLSIAVNLFVWPLGAALLCLCLFKDVTWAPGFAMVFAIAGVAFPTRVSTYGVLWPLALGYALVPFLVALAAYWCAGDTFKPRFLPLFFLGVGLVGTALVHPQALLTFGIIGGWLLVALLFRVFSGRQRADRTAKITLLLITATAGVGVTGLLWLIGRGLLKWKRPGTGELWPEIWGALSDSQMRLDEIGNSSPNWLLAVCLVVGMAVLIARRRALWMVGALLTVAIMAVVGGVAGNPLFDTFAPLLSLWYSDEARVGAMIPLLAVPTAALGAGWMAGRLTAFWPRLSIVLPVGLLVAAVPATGFLQRDARADLFGYAYYYSGETGLNGWMSPEELEMIRELDKLLPPDAKIVGDPASGAPLVYALIDRDVVYKFLNQKGPVATPLSQNFSEILTNPAVCQLLEENGIDFFYYDPVVYFIAPGASEQPELNPDSEVLDSLELVAQGGTASVYRLSVCD